MQHTTAEQLRTAVHRYDSEAQISQLRTPRYRMRYCTWGPATGKPLVFIHGLCDQMRSFALMMSLLADAGYRCIGYELADGYSDEAKPVRYLHTDYTKDLLALLDHLNLSQVDLFGSSFGSTITLRSLAQHPERFRKACIQGGFARRPLNGVERFLSQNGRHWPWKMGQLPVRNRVMERLERNQFVGCPWEVFRFLLKNSGATSAKAAAYRALILDKLDLRPMLPSIPHQLLMIGGDIDQIVPRQYEAEVEAGVKHAHRVEFSPCGHYPQYTLPSDSVRVLRSFLEG